MSTKRQISAGCPRWVDSVEKVLSAVGIQFLRAADAFNAVRHGGPHRLERNLSATFFFAWRTHRRKKSAPGKLLRGFCFGSTFDFFNRIGQRPKNSRRAQLVCFTPGS
jgi:hypothetical protein